MNFTSRKALFKEKKSVGLNARREMFLYAKKKKMWPTDTVAGVSIVGVLLLLVFL